MEDEEFNLWADDSNWEERPGFHKPVDISIDDHKLRWKPGFDELIPLEGTFAKEIAQNLYSFFEIRQGLGGSIDAGPNWPSIPASISNLYAVVWALDALYGDHKIAYFGDAPSIKDIRN